MDFFSLPLEKRENAISRFNNYVEKRGPQDCWIYKGPTLRGYGQLMVSMGRKKAYALRAHRLAWIIHYNANIPPGLVVCHSCDNKLCVNTMHLFLGTQQQNLRDCVLKDRRMKYNAEKRLEIAAKVLAGGTLKSVGKEYNIGQDIVWLYLRTKEVVTRYGKIDLRYRNAINLRKKREVCPSAQKSPDGQPVQLSLI